ncbi:precorrin-3B C(17)-methyltransferase [Acuticoccus sp.]|uniref:precorrin-3B C(17)-methyltransferase n=1 Tax=Acuticoccus sp. TaxID=1904378 RepID=UPI003B52148D
MSAATLAIVGVGPGDPELLTLKAARLIAAADVVAYPQTATGSLAAGIAEAHVTGERLPFAVPMGEDAAPAYDDAAEAIAVHLAAGRSVAVLCEGDPMLYGSAASLLSRLAGRAPVTVVPGVAALTACAAAAGTSLARGDAPVTVMPATADARELRAALARPGALVLYKVGRRFDEVAAMVRAAGRDGTLVVRATGADEEVVALTAAAPGPKPYFSTILLPAAAPLARTEPDGRIAVIVLGPSGLAVGEACRSALAAAGRAVTLEGLASRVPAEAVDAVFADAVHHLQGLFRAGVAIVGVCATGILVRAVAPLLADKRAEPSVVAVAEDGSAVVPLLNSHRGGGRIATVLGEAFGVAPAVTTQGDLTLGLALDDPPHGWRVADPAPFKALVARVAAGDGVATDVPFLASLPRGEAVVRQTIRPAADASCVPTYVARRIALGMGAERGADPDAAVAAARRAIAAADLDPRAVAVVASLDLKADEPALAGVAQDLDVPLRVFAREALASQEPRLATPSEVVRAAVGVAGVAEAAALAAVGPDGRLLAPKTVHGAVTTALAEAPEPIGDVGRARGKLIVVGVGPGTRLWRTAECLAALASADAFVGYTLYLDLVEDLRATQTRHDFALGDEAARARFALERAGEGQSIALISSGDPGVFAMATLAVELLERGDLSDAARRVELVVVPGITAAQAAAARVGAPLGHDFAAISLSDLLTPWPVIERRLTAAADADLALALYNPRSQRRTTQLDRAVAILAKARRPDTPVVVAASLGRPEEATTVTTLAALDPASVTMLSIVLVGASTTRAFVRGDGLPLVYTPRGYAT